MAKRTAKRARRKFTPEFKKAEAVLALHALEDAVSGRPSVRAGLIHHTDRSSPYASDDYRAALSSHGMIASMSRKGDCCDNAVAESFFATLRAELVDGERYMTREEAEMSIGAFIDRLYNVERLHSYLDFVSPLEFELKMHVSRIES